MRFCILREPGYKHRMHGSACKNSEMIYVWNDLESAFRTFSPENFLEALRVDGFVVVADEDKSFVR